MVILSEIFEVCIIPLLGILTTILIKYIKAKFDESIQNTDNELEKKYLKMLSDTITDCVIATNQTYVNALKEQGKFDAEAQKLAFALTFEAVYNILSDDAIEYLTESLGDLETYISQKIEATVNKEKGEE